MLCFLQLPIGCDTAVLPVSLMPWWFVLLQFAPLYFGVQISLRCHEVLSLVRCEDRGIILTTSLSNSQELQQNSKINMLVTEWLMSQSAVLLFPKICCSVHVCFTTHLARNLSSDLCVYRGVCRNGEAGRDVCSVLQAAPLCNCDSVYKGTHKIKLSH